MIFAAGIWGLENRYAPESLYGTSGAIKYSTFSQAESPPDMSQARGAGRGGIEGGRRRRCSPGQTQGVRLALSAVNDPGITLGWIWFRHIHLSWWLILKKAETDLSSWCLERRQYWYQTYCTPLICCIDALWLVIDFPYNWSILQMYKHPLLRYNRKCHYILIKVKVGKWKLDKRSFLRTMYNYLNLLDGLRTLWLAV